MNGDSGILYTQTEIKERWMEMRKEKPKRNIKIIFHIKNQEVVKEIEKFIEVKIIPIQKKYPYAEISIEAEI